MDLLFFTSPLTTRTTTTTTPALFFLFLLFFINSSTNKGGAVHCATFTFSNRCDNTVWPGVLSNSGSPSLGTTGFELPKGASRSFQAPTGWSGRFWGRTACAFDSSSSSARGSCATGDCGSGQIECNGAGAEPPATLAEFTLGGASGQDFYDVSLVDGYNLPVVVEVSGGRGGCATTGCAADLNRRCPAELRVGDGEACRSACEAFGKPEFCCSGDYANPSTCRPSVYSEMFKSACPRSYSYAYDDATSTFTCSGADYTITFCPSSVGSQKSSQDSSSSSSGGGGGSTTTTSTTTTTTAPPRTTTDGGVMMENDAWLASLATGDATTVRGKERGLSLLHHASLIVTTTFILLGSSASSLIL